MKDSLAKVSLSVSFADRADETSSLCKYIAPAPHYLESWGDAEPKVGYYSLQQPAISLIYKTRQAQSKSSKMGRAQRRLLRLSSQLLENEYFRSYKL
ncbi:MAG: hypothetical protein R2822_06290 [Spirosomataceae bacterium]